MEKTNVIKLKYLRAGQPSGREYTFYTPAPVEVGDIVDIAVVSPDNTKAKKKTYKVGDVVNFHGGKHYISSYPGAKGYNVSAGRAKITIANGSGKAHPWHLVYENWSETHVYGWVDDGSFD